MASDRAAPPSFCLEVDITQSGADVSAVSRGFEKLVSRPQSLGTRDVIGQFEQWVRSAAQRSAPLNPAVLAEDLHAALFQGEFLDALTTLRVAASGGQLLVRLIPHGRDLEATPWEALCRRGKRLDFLGTSQELLFVRGVHSTRPVKRSEVRTAVRMLVISPLDEDAPDLMRAELQSTIDSGHLEWMEPLTGPRARWDFVRKQLIREPVPHIIHFIGHGSASPSLQLAEEDGRESWLKVELLARLLEPAFDKDLRLIVLESCEGAQPGELTSAAARLGESGADAVVAHLWPVKAPVARHCSKAFYEALVENTAHRGDVARSLNAARISMLGSFKESAEAFSPVLYLRDRDPILFDFQHRKPVPPRPRVDAETPEVRELLELMGGPFSLLLGDRWSASLAGFRKTLQDKLTGAWAAPEGTSMSALAQRYALKSGAKSLSPLFQLEFRDAVPSIPLVDAVALHLPPGVHFTLMRTPVLEEALVRLRPKRKLYVVQPQGPAGGGLVLRLWDGDEWLPIDELPEDFDAETELTLVRLYRGYLPDCVFEMPLLTEDDYLTDVRDLESLLTPELADILLGTLRNRPALLLGMSLLTWHHRMLLHQLFDAKQLPEKSQVVLERGEPEAESWTRGRGLPRNGAVRVVQADAEQLTRLIGSLAPVGEP